MKVGPLKLLHVQYTHFQAQMEPSRRTVKVNCLNYTVCQPENTISIWVLIAKEIVFQYEKSYKIMKYNYFSISQ